MVFLSLSPHAYPWEIFGNGKKKQKTSLEQENTQHTHLKRAVQPARKLRHNHARLLARRHIRLAAAHHHAPPLHQLRHALPVELKPSSSCCCCCCCSATTRLTTIIQQQLLGTSSRRAGRKRRHQLAPFRLARRLPVEPRGQAVDERVPLARTHASATHAPAASSTASTSAATAKTAFVRRAKAQPEQRRLGTRKAPPQLFRAGESEAQDEVRVVVLAPLRCQQWW